MNYKKVGELNKTSFLYPPPTTSVLGNLNNEITNNIDNNSYKYIKYKNSINNPTIKIKNENKYAYSMIWKAIHYVSNFLNIIPGEEYETENAFITFINSISILLPNQEYSRHMKEFIYKYPLNNLKTNKDRFKWTYKLHSYINFMRFIQYLKYYLIKFSKKDIENIFNNYCLSLELNKEQIKLCTTYINNKIKYILKELQSSTGQNNETENINEDYVFIKNISYQEALDKYSITDTNIITKMDWGPTIWMLIHFFAANITKEKINTYIVFINSLTYILPCQECKTHLRKNIKIIPLVIDNDTNNLSLFEWSCKLHNLVNVQLKKSTFNLCNSLFYKYLDNYNSTYDYI